MSHFGVTRALAGDFRFNILHVDGHVDDSVWKQVEMGGNWLVDGSDWHWGKRPYGWDLINWDDGLKEKPMFEGAFDQNASEYREVER